MRGAVLSPGLVALQPGNRPGAQGIEPFALQAAGRQGELVSQRAVVVVMGDEERQGHGLAVDLHGERGLDPQENLGQAGKALDFPGPPDGAPVGGLQRGSRLALLQRLVGVAHGREQAAKKRAARFPVGRPQGPGEVDVGGELTQGIVPVRSSRAAIRVFSCLSSRLTRANSVFAC